MSLSINTRFTTFTSSENITMHSSCLDLRLKHSGVIHRAKKTCARAKSLTVFCAYIELNAVVNARSFISLQAYLYTAYERWIIPVPSL